MKKDIVYDIWMSLASGLHAKLSLNLLQHFGSAKILYENRMNLYGLPFGTTKTEREPFEKLSLSHAERIIEKCLSQNIDIITVEEKSYPERLRQIYDPPAVLYVKGTLPPIDESLTIGVVGTRNYSDYGRRVAENLAKGLASVGAVIVSGMARGVDTAAHKGALKGDGKTVAVLGSAIDEPYPRENRDLYDFITANGAVLSEFAPGAQITPQNFPHRNRIVTGLSLGLLVVEAPERSGALISARLSLEQNRDLFVVPGNIDSPFSKGSNKLLKTGAKLVTEPIDILSEYIGIYPQTIKAPEKKRSKSFWNRRKTEEPVEMGKSAGTEEQKIRRREFTPKTKPVRTTSEGNGTKDLQLSPEEGIIKDALRETSMTADELTRRTGLPIQTVAVALTMLEIKNHIHKIDGERFTI